MNTIVEIIIAKCVLLLFVMSGVQELSLEDEKGPGFLQIPVLELNFYTMGRTDVDPSTLFKIKQNVAFLNEEFENVMKFEVSDIVADEGHALLPDLHKEYFNVQQLTVDSLLEVIEKQGSINIYIFETYAKDDLSSELMGFTPIFKEAFGEYAEVTPSFDRIFISYSSLDKQSTIVHEMGHFLGLDHPWEMNEEEKSAMGLQTSSSVELNHMAYGSKVCTFTKQQLLSMHDFTLNFRNYLISKRIYQFRQSFVSVE
jgi:hypothetical protein